MNEKIVILGGAETGVGAAILARKKGFDVFVSDAGRIKEKYQHVLLHNEIVFEEGFHSIQRILDADEIIKSPGIPDSLPLIQRCEEIGIPIVSDIEFASRFTNAKMICITGSNGKTTTTLLTYHMFKKAGLSVGLGGNVGQSFAWQVAESDPDVFILELSSFQLDRMYDFKADVAILMNITPDHLDRYDNNFQNYVDAKFRIVQNQREQDVLIYNADDPVIIKELEKRKIPSKTIPFSLTFLGDGDRAFIHENIINIHINSIALQMTLNSLALQGKHNHCNSMAAGLAGRLYGIRKEVVKESFSDFQGVEHRLEFVAKIHGIEFINDSKATNVNSTWFALESMNKPVIWIVGGQDKGNDYESLKCLVKAKVKAIVCLGSNNVKIKETFADVVSEIVETTNAQKAVELAYYLGKTGDAVLLSPACASFDLFQNFEDRGTQFKRAVYDL